MKNLTNFFEIDFTKVDDLPGLARNKENPVRIEISYNIAW